MATQKYSSREESIEDYFKQELRSFDVRYFTKTEAINAQIDDALRNAKSKSGGNGINYPDIKVLLDDHRGRCVPVMIEAKGARNRLVKLNKNDELDLTDKAKVGWAVNGAVHYAQAVIDSGYYEECLAIGVNGYEMDGRIFKEIRVYYVSDKNFGQPIRVDNDDLETLALLKPTNTRCLYERLDSLMLSDSKLQQLKSRALSDLEKEVNRIHQYLYDDERFRSVLSTDEKLHLFSGLIIANLEADGVPLLDPSELKGVATKKLHDGAKILNQIEAVLSARQCPDEKKVMIVRLLTSVFDNPLLYTKTNGVSPIKELFVDIKDSLMCHFKKRMTADFMGLIFNKLSDWMNIKADVKNDVVLTPRYVTNLMAKLCRTDKDSLVWDTAMGSGGFLVSAMEIMIEDAKKHFANDEGALQEKVEQIRKNQLLGIEILDNVFLLAVINMILSGDGSSRVIHGDSSKFELPDGFPANVFLLNPPYSAPGKGLGFVHHALSRMEKGYGCVLIQENAGAGQGQPYAKEILQTNTLRASIHMADIFKGKAGVQTAIYLFEVARQHQPDDLVTFIDFSEDGYLRQNRKKSTETVNLQDVDHAVARYDEVAAIVLGKKAKTDFYTEANGKVIRDTISIDGDDWTFSQHQKVDISPKLEDFQTAVKDFLSWKVDQIIRGDSVTLGKTLAPV